MPPRQVTPILAFAGALIVALIAARTATHNVRNQLEAEHERLGETLAQEGKRLQQRLDHEQKLVDIQYLRECLDDAATACEVAIDLGTRFCIALKDVGGDDDSERMSKRMKAILDRMNDAYPAATKVTIELHRLEMRIGPDNPVIRAFRDVDKHVRARHSFLLDAVSSIEPLSEEANDTDTAHLRDATGAFRKFTEAARSEIGTLEAKAAKSWSQLLGRVGHSDTASD